MNNDLISREALKEKWKEECCGCCENCSHCMTGLNCELIDNAPTVEPVGHIINAYTTGFDTGVETVKRPRGEWIDHSEDYGYVECPFCEHLTTCGDNIDELHYCWSCGAKLGKGGAE